MPEVVHSERCSLSLHPHLRIMELSRLEGTSRIISFQAPLLWFLKSWQNKMNWRGNTGLCLKRKVQKKYGEYTAVQSNPLKYSTYLKLSLQSPMLLFFSSSASTYR